MHFQKELLINAPPDKIFTYVSDLPRHPEWAAHRLKIEPQSAGAAGVGSKYSSVGHQMGMDSHDEVTVTEYSPSQRFGYEARSKEGRFRHVIQLRPEGAGTRVAKSVEVVEASLSTKLMTPLLMFLAPRILSSDLKRIKERIE